MSDAVVPMRPSTMGVVLQELKAPAMQSPTRIAIAPSGRVAISDPQAHLVHIFAPDLSPLRSLEVGQPLGVAFGSDGRLFVGDRDTGAVRIYDADYDYDRLVGSGAGEVTMPNDIAYSATRGQIHVTDSMRNEVAVYTQDGSFVQRYGRYGAAIGQFNFPTGIAIDDARAEVYVADHTNARVHVFDLDGRVIRAFSGYGAESGQLTRPQGIALGDDGLVLVVDIFQGQLQAFDRSGNHLGFIGDYGIRRGQIVLPMDVAHDGRGHLFVTSTYGHKVVVFGLGEFDDLPAPAVAAVVDVIPESISRSAGADAILTVLIEPDGEWQLSQLDAQSIRFAGLPYEGPVKRSDLDRDGTPEISFSILQRDVLATLDGVGQHQVPLDAALRTDARVVGSATLRVE